MGKKFGAQPIRERSNNNTEADRQKSGYYMDHPCDEVFTCKVCGKEIHPEGASSDHRNHCPNCLSSLHLDVIPGDRSSDCGGVMEPIAVWVRGDGEWAIIHRCKKCGALSSNRVAADDNPLKLMSIAVKPLANPPFPIERMQDMAESLKQSDI
ncbi:MAG: RNHCP domain-containing protein [Lachnospiraceae bacterium]|nr:RNHCP domain-containing protein [Lachnospiraceae bacterium]